MCQESRVEGNEEQLATISNVLNAERKIEEDSSHEIEFIREATAQAIIKEKEQDESDEKLLAKYLTTLKYEAEDFYNEAYHDYYSKNPEAFRYNLCFASSSPYFKAAVLIAKLGERTYQDFTKVNDFFSFIENNLEIPLKREKFIFPFLTATLDREFDGLFIP